MTTDMARWDEIEDLFADTKYRPVEPLGRGGTSVVLTAKHRSLGKVVAIKLLSAGAPPDFEERLRVEAQALARLRHRCLVDVLDFGRARDGRGFFVMEKLTGRTLRQLVDDEVRLDYAIAVRFARQVLAGLGAAHRLGVIHRDIKPENVFVCEPPADETNARATIKILDFGFAKVVAPSHEGPDPSLFSTEEGLALGTARFAAPEQARGEEADRRTDLYAVGALLYFMISGFAPFEHHRDLACLVRAIREEEPAPLSQFAPVSPALEAVVARALAKDPNDRFQSATELANALLSSRPSIRKVSRTAPLALDGLAPSPAAPEFLRTPRRRR